MAGMRYESHDLVLEPSSWQVRVGETLFTPEPKVFELLAYLMRNHGRVVSKAELLDSLWAGEVVGESVLTRCVSCVRKLLRDEPRAPKFIRTVHGRGYEFVAPVDAHPVSSAEATRQLTAQSSAPPHDPRLGDGRFIGRAEQTARINELVRQIGAGRAKLALVSGEAGIGKTRLLEETMRGQESDVVHWGRASGVAGAPPFFLWRQCLRSVVKARSMKTVLRAFRESDADARQLVLGAALGSDSWQMGNAPGWDSQSHRFRVFDAITRAFGELAVQRPLIFVFDDLHAADPASLLLLDFVREQLSAPVLLLGAVRSSSTGIGLAPPQMLTHLRASSHAEIELSGLTRSEVAAFVGSRFAVASSELVEELHARTGGNPFFLSVLGPYSTRERLPAAARQIVAGRLASLSRECRDLLAMAAVHGRRFDASLLARATSMPVGKCFTLLKSASEASLLFSSTSERFQFAHDLVREVLYDELDGEPRARAHLALARVLETLPEYQRTEQAAILAHHFEQGIDFGGASRALDLSIRAGAYALRNYAYEDAVQHFARAGRLLAACADVDPATECAVLLDLGVAQVSAGSRQAGQETLLLAAAKARAQGSAELLASVALGLAPGLFSIETGVYDAGLVQLLREAIAQVAEGNDRLRALLLARLALALYWSDTFDERLRACDEADELAERLAADDVRAVVGTARVFALLRPGDLRERCQLAERMSELSRRVGDHQSSLLNRLLLAAAFLEGGDAASAAFEVDAFRKLAEETRQPQALWIVQAHRASSLLLDGRLDEVEQLAGQCLITGQRTRDHNALLTFGVHLTLVRIEQARGAEVLDVIRDYAARYPRIMGWRVLHAYVLGRAGQGADCLAEYESLKSRRFELPDDLNWPASMAWLSETCHALDDREGAAVLYERFSPLADRLVVIGYGIACLGSVARYLGLLCTTLGRPADALRHFEQAVNANRRAAAHLPLAYTLLDYASALRASSRAAAESHILEVAAFTRARELAALGAALENLTDARQADLEIIRTS